MRLKIRIINWLLGLLCGDDVLDLTKPNVKIPHYLIEPKISDLKIGQSCWTVSWAMWLDKGGNFWLNTDYMAHSSQGGTVDILITRLDECKYQVDVSKTNRQFAEQMEACYVGHTGGFGQVVRIVGLRSYQAKIGA